MNIIESNNIVDNFSKIAKKYQELLIYLSQGKGNIISKQFLDEDINKKIFLQMLQQFMSDPCKYMEVNLEFVNKYQTLINNSLNQFMGKHTEDKQESKFDKRFKDQDWENNNYFHFIKEFYLISSELIEKNIKQYKFDSELNQYLHFMTKQFLDAFAPSNFPMLNPVVVKETIRTSGANIIQGLDNLLNDIKESGDFLNIQMTDEKAFQIGKNIAATEGKIIFQNKLVQLICYKPMEKTYEIPILIIPPCINKYYILDLSQHNSMVSYLVNNNFQVFILSFVNPDETYSETSLEDYVLKAILEPIDYIIKELNYKKINCHGYCIGGTFLAILLSYLKSRNIDYINSAGFMASMFDFTNPGEIGSFINEIFIDKIEENMNKVGYFDGKYLSNSFSMLRANDLIWSFFINNYLLGKNPVPFDLLYWNSDSTNLPAKMHNYYLRELYLKNLLAKNGGILIDNIPINLGNIDIDSFFIATSEDHISPWKSVYDSMKLLGGKKSFCLAGSGHVAGIINSPNMNKYHFFINQLIDNSHDLWFKNAIQYEGSWWDNWVIWLKEHSNKLKKSIDYKSLYYIEDAPGSYVRKKIT
jgi:polyhydroxyalkanoate synthase